MDFAYIVFVAASCLLQICSGQDPAADAVTFTIQIIPSSAELNFEVGSSRVLTCESSRGAENALPVLHWQKGDEKITATSETERIRIESKEDNKLMLRLTNVQNGDEGSYKCVGTLGAQVDSRSVRIMISRALKINSPKEQHGILGDDGILECDATGQPPPTLTWKFENYTDIRSSSTNSSDEYEKYIIRNNRLEIKGLTFEDAGKYLCDVIVMETGVSQAFFITYSVVQLPKINVQPTISPNNPKVGDRVQIACQAEGVPKPTYQFKKGDNLLSDDMVDKVNGILTIANVTRQDEATYTCIATNRGGSDEESNTLDVKIVPKIEPIPDVTDALEDGEQQVVCSAEGDPEPTVTWQKVGSPAYIEGTNEDGREIVIARGNDNSNAEIKRVSSTMIFKPIRPQDAGEYECTAFNAVGEVARKIKFEVKYAPHFDTDFTQRVFYGWNGHTANLTCQASANELAVIKFFDPNPDEPDDFDMAARIQNEAPFVVTTTQRWEEYKLSSASLLISIAGSDRSLYKDYFCEAENSMGKKHQIITLKEAVPPGMPTITASDILATMMILRVEAPNSDGGQPVTSYLYSYNSNGGERGKEQEIERVPGAETTLELKNLKAETTYSIYVRAKNNVGPGTEATLVLDTVAVSVPLKMVLTSPQEGTSPTSYRLQWMNVDDGGDPIYEILVKYKKVEVAGDTPEDWVVVDEKTKEFTEVKVPNPSSTLSFTVQNLERDTYYDVRIMARNSMGWSRAEQRIIKTSKGADPVVTTTDDSMNMNEKNGDAKNDGDEEEDESGETVGHSSGAEDPAGAGGLGSGVVIGIIVGLIVLVLLVVVIIFLITKKKPELVGRLRGRLAGKGGEEERGTKEDGKDPAEEEKLIKKEDTVKVENETEEGKTGGDVLEEQPEEFEPDNKPEAQAAPEPEKKEEPAAEKPKELSTPAPTTEIKITPETPEKPENPPA